MRLVILAVFASLAAAAAPAALADPAYEAHSAVGACLAAVIDNAPVVDGKGQDVSLHREGSPNLCVVTVTGGDPSEVRRSVLDAIAARPEAFSPAKTAWAAGDGLRSRETLCNAPGRRALNVVLETAKPGASPALVATVVEGRKRDQRCDLDMGLQP
jgi:hypothetical protein